MGGGEDVEEESLRVAQHLVYGWPAVHEEPTRPQDLGRFVKSFPLDFPMGTADLHEERRWKVSTQEWVQHLLRY